MPQNELAHRHRETHRRIADMGAVDDGRDEQTQCLPHSHGDHENRRRGHHQQQRAAIQSWRRRLCDALRHREPPGLGPSLPGEVQRSTK